MSNANVSLGFAFPDYLFEDLVSYWMMKSNPLGELATAISATDTSCTIVENFNIPAGLTIAIEGEPISIASISGQTINFGPRGQYATRPAAAHAQGTSVELLIYPTWFDIFATEAALPWATQALQAVIAKGNSVTVPKPTGTLTVTIS